MLLRRFNAKAALYLCIMSVYGFAQNQLPRDNDGWTIFTPHAETEIVYVSSSLGDDAEGTAYDASSPEIGDDPFLPSGAIKPFKTLEAAYEAVRNGKPDWVLLRRDDIWYETLVKRNGLSDEAPFLVSSYGPGDNRPLLKTGDQSAIRSCCKNFNNMAFADIDFYAHTRNPDSDEYTGPEGRSGISIYVGETWTGDGLLIEGCRFRFYSSNVIQGPGTLKDMVVRRSVILDNYSTEGHSQGLYTDNVSILLEENVFDHNGWYKHQLDGGNDKQDGQATMFNHNTYFSHSHDVTFRENIFLRASSIGNKWTANSGEASARNIVIENNLYVEGEIGISIGGNETEPPYRFKNVAITDNVFLDMGRDQPTGRTLGWYIEIQDWDGGVVENNFLLHNTNPDVGNVWGLKMQGETRDVVVDGNTIHGLATGHPLINLEDGSTKENITICNNTLYNDHANGRLIKTDGNTDNYSFFGNKYFCTRQTDEWFEVGSELCGFDGWSALSSETNASCGKDTHPDPNRTIPQYMGHLGNYSETFEAFIEEVREQRKGYWRTEFTAAEFNDWIKQGFKSEPTNTEFGGNRPSSTARHIHSKQPPRYRAYNLSGRYLGIVDSKNAPARFGNGVVILHPLKRADTRSGAPKKDLIFDGH